VLKVPRFLLVTRHITETVRVGYNEPPPHKVLTTSQPDYLHNLISVQSTCIEPAPHPLLLLLDHLYVPHYKSPTAPLF